MTDKINIERLKVLIEIRNLIRVIAMEKWIRVREYVLTTRIKRKVFNLCTGKNTKKEIANKLEITDRYVEIILEDFEKVGIIIYEKKKPQRLV